MKAMVLAAGQGTRLQPLTERRPKALVPVAGRPMIEYSLLLLKRYGIRDIIINLHHLGDQIENYLGDGKHWGLQITYSKEPELLDTGGGLLKAKPFLEGGPFIVINTDVLIDLSLTELIAFHEEKRAAATLVLRPDPLADQYGSIEIDGEGRIRRFLQAQVATESSVPTTKLMFTGVQILEPRVFDHMAPASALRKFSTTKDTYPRMLLGQERLFGFRFEGFWQDVGTASRIKEAEDSLAAGKATLHYL
ncbi:MAG TPA: nucleotidyltransferase family protein [Candidatus Binatia bacterium]|nr:nucleotidyltransferase family protein [Candidatus Binatia bacterium]